MATLDVQSVERINNAVIFIQRVTRSYISLGSVFSLWRILASPCKLYAEVIWVINDLLNPTWHNLTIREDSWVQQDKESETYSGEVGEANSDVIELLENYSRSELHAAGAFDWLRLCLDMLSSIVFVFILIFLVSIPHGTIYPTTRNCITGKQPQETASQEKKILKKNTSGSKKQNTQNESVNIEGDIPAMRPQVVKGSNNKTRSVLASTNGSGSPARQSKGKNSNSAIEINNPDDLNIRRRGRPSKRVIDVNNKSDSSIPHPGIASNVRIDSSKKQTSAPKTTIFASDTPCNYQEGVKGSRYKTSAMYSSRLKSDAPSRQFQGSRIPKKKVPGSSAIGNYTARSVSKHKYNMRVQSKSSKSNMSNFTAASQVFNHHPNKGYGKQPAYMAEDDVDTSYYGSVSLGKKGSQSKNPVMNRSTTNGTYLHQQKHSSMNVCAFGYAP
ncbi:AAA+ ATPase domain-containing protein [Artemisia annua]|uniref:AAA+ ATPase domain-containing protein n=1 Tax=Artemisia annua TaxID=35608 RepID=A0A2U1PEZ7_ARTAN|nr:AAA+ ATPase domain-containing protein [Artemisia annua]